MCALLGVYSVPQRLEEGFKSSWTGVTDGHVPPYRCWEPNLAPLQELQVLFMAEPSLQPLQAGFELEILLPQSPE